MSDGGQITVELIAKIDELTSGLQEAVAAVRNATNEITDSFQKTGDKGKETDGLLKSVLSGAAFLEFKEIAKDALEVVNAALDETVGKAMEFGLANAKFAAMMGTSETDAAGLSAALKGVGVSSEEYEGMAMRLEMRLKQQEKAWHNYGMATRDASGDLMGGKDLMDSAISTMEQYKSGTDQNEFALQVFGRRAAAVYDIMRVSKAAQDQYTQDMRDLGVATSGTAQTSAEFEEAQARQKQQWLDLEIAIGQKLMPVMTEFFNWLNGNGKTIINGASVAIRALIEVVAFLALGFVSLGQIIGGVLVESGDIIFGFDRIMYDVFTGRWGKIKEDAGKSWDDMKKHFKTTLQDMADSADNFVKVHEALFGEQQKPAGGNPYEKSGTKKFKADDGGKGATEARKMADEEAKAAEAGDLEQVKIEADKNSHLLAMGQQTAEQYTAEQTRMENEAFAIKSTYLEKRIQLDVKDKVQHQKDLDDLKTLQTQHEEALTRIKDQGEERRAALDRQATQEYITEANDRLANGIQKIEEEFKSDVLSANERGALEKQLTVTIYQQELARLNSEAQTLVKGTELWNTNYKQRQKIAEDLAKAVAKIDDQTAAQERQKWTTLTNSIKTSFNSALNGMIEGTTTWQQAVGSLVNSVLDSFLQMGEQMLEDWIQKMIMKQIVGDTTQQTMQLTTVTSNAEIAASGAMAAISAIPYVGPFMAPAVAAETFAGTMAFAEQGMLVDRDRMIFAHKDEQVLPANISRGMQDLIKGGGSGNDVHLHYGPTVNAPGHKSLDQLLNDESHTMVNWIHARMRDGSLKGR